jgi:rhamnogalacturonan endolyase
VRSDGASSLPGQPARAAWWPGSACWPPESSRTVRIGITAAYAGGRLQITVNGWTSPAPSASAQPSSRSMTIGTYRGNNTLFTHAVPASAFVAGVNTMTITVISGSGSLSNYLSPAVSYDCVEMY